MHIKNPVESTNFTQNILNGCKRVCKYAGHEYFPFQMGKCHSAWITINYN